MVASLLGAHLAGDGETIVLAVLVVALDIKVGEVDGDPESDKIIIQGRGNEFDAIEELLRLRE